MQLNLDDDQAAVLRETLDAAIRDLSWEIADADTPDFRAQLKLRRDRLQGILHAVGGSIPNSEVFRDTANPTA